jgi:hypothetical protein
LVALAALALTVGFSGTSVRYDEQPEGTAEGKEPYHFTSVESMTATSHLVIYGEVTATAQGRFTGVDEDPAAVGGQVRLRNVTITVWDVLHNPKNALIPPSITLEEEGWDEQGNGYITNNVAWSQVGDTGYFFLRKAIGTNVYQLASSDGRALVVNDTLQPSNPENDLANQIATMGPISFEMTVSQASQQYAAGQLSPATETADQPLTETGSGE